METERQSPDTIAAQTNLSGVVGDIQDDPDSPDANWMVASGNSVNTDVRVTLPTPTGNPTVGADLQEFKTWVRQFDTGQTGDPTARIELWENGSLIRAGSDVAITGSGQMVVFPWNANELVTSDGSLVECKVVGVKSGGGPSKRNTIDIGAIEWNVEYSAGSTPVSKDLNIKWDTRALASKDLNTIWNVRALASKALNLRWNIRGLVNKSLNLVWNVRALAGKTLQIVWNVRALTSKTLNIIWNVLTNSTPVSKVLNLKWDVRAVVSKPIVLKWNVRAVITKPINIVWNIRTLISKSINIKWGVRTKISKVLNIKWSIRALASKDLILKWNVRAIVKRAIRFIWNVEASVVFEEKMTLPLYLTREYERTYYVTRSERFTLSLFEIDNTVKLNLNIFYINNSYKIGVKT